MKKLDDWQRRVVFSIFAIAAVALLIFFAHHPLVSLLVVVTVAALVGIGVWEYVQLVKAKGFDPSTKLMVTVGVSEVFAFYASLAYPEWSKLAFLIIVLGFVSFFISHFRNFDNAILHVAVELFGVCYLAIPFSFILAILYPPSHHEVQQDGRWWLLYLILVTKMTDIGGYFVGKLVGKHPLAPQLSPKKTIEGAVGGFLSAIALSVALSLFGKTFAISSFDLGIFNAVWIGVVIGILAQIGDLAESLLKRDAFVKDSNRLPAVGGVLDLVDSLLFTSPVVYFFIQK